jgi:hypothetical protein
VLGFIGYVVTLLVFLFLIVIVLVLLLITFLILIPVLIASKGVVTNNESLVCVCAALMLVITALITWVVIKALR